MGYLRRRMKRASVIPNRKIIRIPLESYLQVVVR
jgi:hypothetical protein